MKTKLITIILVSSLLLCLTIPGAGVCFESGSSLDIVLSSPTENFYPSGTVFDIKPGDSVYREVRVSNVGTDSLEYEMYVEKISGDDNFCNALELFLVIDSSEMPTEPQPTPEPQPEQPPDESSEPVVCSTEHLDLCLTQESCEAEGYWYNDICNVEPGSVESEPKSELPSSESELLSEPEPEPESESTPEPQPEQPPDESDLEVKPPLLLPDEPQSPNQEESPEPIPQESIPVFQGNLIGFNVRPPWSVLNPGEEDNWFFTAVLPSENFIDGNSKLLQNKTCQFKFIFIAQQVLTEPIEPPEENESTESTSPENAEPVEPVSPTETESESTVLLLDIGTLYFSDTEEIINTLKSGYWEVPENQPPVLLVHGFQLIKGFNPNEIWRNMVKGVTDQDIEDSNWICDVGHCSLQFISGVVGNGKLLCNSDWYFMGDEDPFSNISSSFVGCRRGGGSYIYNYNPNYSIPSGLYPVCDPNYCMKRAEGNNSVVYISNYTHNTNNPTYKDIRDYAMGLAFEIEIIKEKEEVDIVDIVAHSMGGLVARTYIESEDLKFEGEDPYGYIGQVPVYRNDVGKLIMLGTPNHGVDLAVIGTLLPATKEYLHIKGCLGKCAICSLDCFFAPREEREECFNECVKKCQECLGFSIEEFKKRLGEYGYISILQMMSEQYSGSIITPNPFLVVLNTPPVMNFETEYSAIAGNCCNHGDGLVDVGSAVNLSEIPKSRRFIYPATHSELITWIVPILTVKHILNEELVPHISMLKFARLRSPGELQVYDFQGRITGFVNGEAKEEIPNSVYDEESKTVVIFEPFDNYYYEVVGTDIGTYGLDIISVENGEATTFSAIDIPTTAGQNHQYTIDWDVLSQDGEGVIFQIDTDGDGDFEKTIIADNDFTYDEFILQTETIIYFEPDTLNLKSKGKFVTAYIELPEGYEINQIDIFSIMLNGLVPVLAKPTEIGDYDNDGISDLMVKFDKSEVQDILEPGEGVILTLTGKVLYNKSYIDFKGSDTIRIIDPGKGKK